MYKRQAYNGDVDFYVVDEEDPIAMTYAKIYPELFKSGDEMPEALKAHIRYPNYLLQIQANIYTRYHMEDIGVFYLNAVSYTHLGHACTEMEQTRIYHGKIESLLEEISGMTGGNLEEIEIKIQGAEVRIRYSGKRPSQKLSLIHI